MLRDTREFAIWSAIACAAPGIDTRREFSNKLCGNLDARVGELEALLLSLPALDAMTYSEWLLVEEQVAEAVAAANAAAVRLSDAGFEWREGEDEGPTTRYLTYTPSSSSSSSSVKKKE